MNKILLVDIGGTSIRSAYCDDSNSELLEVKQELILNSSEVNEILSNLINSEDKKISNLIISVAGPKINNSIQMTNRDYSLDSDNLKSKYNLENVFLLNDWEAIAYSSAHISSQDAKIIKKGNHFNSTSLFIGPGTGLGASILVNDKTVLTTELGNTNLAIDALLKNYNLQNEFSDINNLEDVLSGSGLSKIYNHLHKVDISSEEIFELARNGNQAPIDIISAFIKTLANVLSDLSLTYLPGKSIYIVGGLGRALMEFIDQEEFNKMFLFGKSKNHFEILNSIEISIVTKKHMALYGNLNYFNLIQKGLI